jgi:hypothetical protein
MGIPCIVYAFFVQSKFIYKPMLFSEILFIKFHHQFIKYECLILTVNGKGFLSIEKKQSQQNEYTNNTLFSPLFLIKNLFLSFSQNTNKIRIFIRNTYLISYFTVVDAGTAVSKKINL